MGCNNEDSALNINDIISILLRCERLLRNTLYKQDVFSDADLFSTPLCVPPNYYHIYAHFIAAEIDYYNRDFEGYNRNSALFREVLRGIQKEIG